jgi:ribonuclease P protein component
MISQKHRFHGHNSLNAAYKKGQTVRGEYVSLRYLGTNRPDYRLAVVVSKKVSKSAVVRNRIRRRIYEIIRLSRAENAEPWRADLIISVFDERVATMPPADLQSAISKLFQKAKLV